MKKYIDVEELFEELRIAAEKEGAKANEMAKAGVYDASVKYSHGEYCYIVAQEIVKDIPTADVVEVVRCKDCKHYECGKCQKILYIMDGYYQGTLEMKRSDDFCSNGERKNIC